MLSSAFNVGFWNESSCQVRLPIEVELFLIFDFSDFTQTQPTHQSSMTIERALSAWTQWSKRTSRRSATLACQSTISPWTLLRRIKCKPATCARKASTRRTSKTIWSSMKWWTEPFRVWFARQSSLPLSAWKITFENTTCRLTIWKRSAQSVIRDSCIVLSWRITCKIMETWKIE